MARAGTLGSFLGGGPYRTADGRRVVLHSEVEARRRRALIWMVLLTWMWAEGI